MNILFGKVFNKDIEKAKDKKALLKLKGIISKFDTITTITKMTNDKCQKIGRL